MTTRRPPAPFALRLRECSKPGWHHVPCSSESEAVAGIKFATGPKGQHCEAALWEWSKRNRRYEVIARVTALRHVTHLPRAGAAPKRPTRTEETHQ